MAEVVALLASSGSEQIDGITLGLIELFQMHFPNRISGCYFEGSCADSGLTPLSDIDLVVVFRDTLTAMEQHEFASLHAACKRISPRNLDLSCTDEATMCQANRLQFQVDWIPVLEAVTLKCASLHIYGDDIRAMVPYVPHDVYARTMMHFPFLVLQGQRGTTASLSFPLDYPDPADRFFGYTGRKLRAPDGTLVPSTKRLVHASGFIATALVALHTSLYVADKRTAVNIYRRTINDEWAAHLQAIHHSCRLAWEYRVPESSAEQELLRTLCQRELAFENHFLAIYIGYLMREQYADDEQARQFALKRRALIAV